MSGKVCDLGCRCGRHQNPGSGPLPNRVRVMNAIERAWCGAMIDGEGSVYTHHSHDGRYHHLRATFSNTEVEFISAFLRCVQAGSITADPRRPGKVQWWWSLARQREVVDFLTQIREHSIKAQVALEGVAA